MSVDARMKERFLSRLNELIGSYEGTNTAIFFMGFSPWQNQLIMACEQALVIPRATWFDDDGFLDLTVVESYAKKTILTVCNTEGVVVALYEHLARIRGSLTDLYDGNVVVVTNNLFEKDDLYPCPVTRSSIRALKDYLEQPDRPMPEEAELPSRYYADVSEVEGRFLAAPISYQEEIGYTVIRFYSSKEDIATNASSTLLSLAVPSADFTKYRLDLSDGIVLRACFIVDKNAFITPAKMYDLPAVLSLLDSLGEEYDVVREKPYVEDVSDGAHLLPLLRKYWGAKATFRKLLFYKNPDTTTTMISVSQGSIADQVIQQSTIAMESEDHYQNVFITAPTGAGKSLLFQLPGIYLAEEKGAVTIVIEPIISLMKDQVSALRRRGVTYATALNSDLSYSERMDEIERIKEGSRSIVYLSPELLLSCNIADIIGERKLGLVVVDEAHTVSLWGKDFRSDYWFLGDYLTKLRKYGARFPIMCLTATAVYGGVDDVVFEVIEELELGTPKLFIGNVRRSDISFDITVRNKSKYPGPIDTVKAELAAERLVEYVASNKHALVYCPFRSHVNRIHEFYLGGAGTDSGKVLKYHAGLDKAYKDAAQRRFSNGQCRVMICTKAFGMGVDVDDITDVYHYAPTGSLADYVQEIGRGARRSDVQAVATIDFFPTDARYYAQLYSMSILRLKQLREIMKKLYSIYMKSSPRKQNFLISPESFTYLFGDGADPVNKTKSALMMISKDLEAKYGYPVVIVKSKPTYTKNYVCIPDSLADEFLEKYGKYARRVGGRQRRPLQLKYQPRKCHPVNVSSVGDTYEIDMAKLWEDNFSDVTFGKFKHDFFSGEILIGEDGNTPCMRQRLEIKYEENFEIVCEKFDCYMKAIESVLYGFKMSSHEFTAQEFKKSLEKELGDSSFLDFTEQVLGAFVKSPSAAMTRAPISTIRVLTKKETKNPSDPKTRYAVQDKAYISIASRFARQLRQCKPWQENNTFVVYLSREKQTREEFDLATLLELFGLATYETRGGDEAEIFIRLNDPNKVQALANDPRYRNGELDRLNRRHQNSRNIITSFFMSDLDDDMRWNLIEAYFLGKDEYVSEVLGLETSDGKLQRVVTKKPPKRQPDKVGVAIIKNQGTSQEEKPFTEIWKYVSYDCKYEWETEVFDAIAAATTDGEFEKPYYDVELEIPSTSVTFTCSLAWKKRKVLLFLDEDVDSYDLAADSGWARFLITPGFDVQSFVTAIGA